MAKEFGDFAHDVESAYRSLNSFGSDTAALSWVGQTANAFKSNYGPLPGRLQKLYISYSEVSDALSAYAPKLQASQSKADSALRQAQDTQVDLQRTTTNADTAADDLKTAQQNHATNPNPQAVTDAQTAHDAAQKSLDNAKAKMASLTAQAHQAHDDRIAAAKECAKAIHHAQSDGVHNKHWWQHLGADLAKWGGKIGEIAGDIAPVLDVLAIATSWIPGVDVVTAGLAEADNLIALAGTGVQVAGDAMQGHFGDALMGAGMLGATFLGGRALDAVGGKILGKLGGEAEGEERNAVGSVERDAKGEAGATGAETRSADGVSKCSTGGDPVDLVSGQMVTAEVDLELPGVLPVVLRRAYASGYDTGRLFGPGWSSTLDQRLSINDAGIHFAGDDGQILHYPLPDDDQQVLPLRGARWPLIWDRRSDEIRITDPWAGFTWHFPVTHYREENGRIRDLTAITDRHENRISILRDAHGTPTGLEHAAYRLTIDTVFTGAGPRVSGIGLLGADDSTGVLVKQYQYDEQGRLTGVVNSSGLPYGYEWDHADRITAWVDRLGYRYSYEYGADGRVVRGEGDGGYLSASFDYQDDERSTILTDSLGHQTTYRYDEYGHIAAVVDPAGNVTVTSHDREGNLLSRVDPLGARTSYERDANGDVIRMIAADGTVTQIERNAFHQITVVRQPDGGVWRRSYDERGSLSAVTDPAGAVHTFVYAENGAPTGGTDPLGSAVQFETNAAGLPIATTDPLGSVTRVERDDFGRTVAVTDPLGARTEVGWTLEGNRAWYVGPDGGRTTWSYDAEGRQLSVAGPTGATTAFEPGPFGRPIARTDPNGLRHDFLYDTELRLVEVTNPGRETWRYHYDPAGRLESETDFIGRTLAYEHDVAGRLVGRTTGLGERISLDRDVVGRVVGRSAPEGTFTYRYDAAGRLVDGAGPGTSVTYRYDLLGRVTAESVNGLTSTFGYDAAGRRTRRTTPGGSVSDWRFDAAGQAAALDTGTGRLAFTHDIAGRETERTWGANVWLGQEFDAASRPTRQGLWTGDRASAFGFDSTDGHSEVGAAAANRLLLGRDYTWRVDGVPEQVTDTLRGTRRYTVDQVRRVTAVQAADWSETYAYDPVGNLADAQRSDGHDDVSGDWHTTGTLVRRAGRTNFEYDDAGRRTRQTRRTLDGRRKTWTYTWNADDQLTEAVLPDGTVWTYSYDPLGRRTGKTRSDATDGTTLERVVFTWDGARLAEQHHTREDGTVIALTWDYDPGTFRPAAQRSRTWASAADQDTIDEAFHAIITDLVGTPTELVTPDGRIAWHTTTSLWGRTVATTAAPDVDCPLRFPGQYHDAETGLHYNLHRYYDPDTAGYLTPDPLGLAASPNDHAYVPNPLTWIDPLGLIGRKRGESDIFTVYGRVLPDGSQVVYSPEAGHDILPDDEFLGWFDKQANAWNPAEIPPDGPLIWEKSRLGRSLDAIASLMSTGWHHMVLGDEGPHSSPPKEDTWSIEDPRKKPPPGSPSGGCPRP
nr:RHS repeat-associated core domain-containing protein [Catenulispora pinistramenti]